MAKAKAETGNTAEAASTTNAEAKAPEITVRPMAEFAADFASTGKRAQIRSPLYLTHVRYCVTSRLRNTLRYLIGGLNGYTDGEQVEYGNMPDLEKWIFHRSQA